MKNVSLIYFSATGNTKKVLQTVANSMTKSYKEYDITKEKDRCQGIIPNFAGNDLVLVGVPVYSGRVPKFLINYLKTIKGNNTKLVVTVNYGNRGYEDALIELKDIFESNGFMAVSAASFVGEHSYTPLVATNRPDENDLKIAHDFGEKTLKKLESMEVQGKDRIVYEKLPVKGNVPYVEKAKKSVPPTAPVTNSSCINCGLCAEICIAEAINPEDCTKADPNKCMHCCRCIKACPVNAKEFEAEWVKNIINKLVNNCTKVRKEPELFF